MHLDEVPVVVPGDDHTALLDGKVEDVAVIIRGDSAASHQLTNKRYVKRDWLEENTDRLGVKTSRSAVSRRCKAWAEVMKIRSQD